MLNISCLKGDSDQTKFRFGISVKNCIGCDTFRKNPRNFIFPRKIYRKSGCCLSKIRKFWANSAHLRIWPRYWCDNAVWKIWRLWGHYFWNYRVNGRTYWPISECTHFSFWVHKNKFSFEWYLSEPDRFAFDRIMINLRNALIGNSKKQRCDFCRRLHWNRKIGIGNST